MAPIRAAPYTRTSIRIVGMSSLYVYTLIYNAVSNLSLYVYFYRPAGVTPFGLQFRKGPVPGPFLNFKI